MFQVTTALKKIYKLTRKIKGVQGGTSAGKTYNIIPIEIDYAIKHPFTETSIVAESFPHLRRGAMRDFKKIMKETGRWKDKNWRASESTYTFDNESFIEFFSADDDSKLRGARRDRLYMNEANNMTLHAYNELASRTKQSVILDWNPVNSFWFHEELKDDDDVDFIVLTYKDNEACPQSAIDFILKAQEKAKTSNYWKNWYSVYGLGQIGNLEGVVFENWKHIAAVPSEAKLVCYGMDFGFSNDPTTLIAMYKWNNKIIFDELLYMKGLTNGDIAKIIKKHPRATIYADSAEPKSIEEIRRYGISIKGAKKGKDSINYGISLLQEQDILITKRSVNMTKELRSYVYDTDKEGNKTNKPIGAFDHTIDPMRYIAVEKLTNKRKRFSIKT